MCTPLGAGWHEVRISSVEWRDLRFIFGCRKDPDWLQIFRYLILPVTDDRSEASLSMGRRPLAAPSSPARRLPAITSIMGKQINPLGVVPLAYKETSGATRSGDLPGSRFVHNCWHWKLSWERAWDARRRGTRWPFAHCEPLPPVGTGLWTN